MGILLVIGGMIAALFVAAYVLGGVVGVIKGLRS